jgi:hypothetical protein
LPSFANPIRNCRIEIEARTNTINNYSTTYQALTGAPLPIGTDAVYSLPNDGNKWGREMRVYFSCTNDYDTPDELQNLMTVGGRPGYDVWNRRLNNIAIIDELFSYGFVIGSPQDETRIRATIDTIDNASFDRGYALP